MISLMSTSEYKNWPNRFYDAAAESVFHLQNGCYAPHWEIVPQSGDTLPVRGKRTMQVRLLPGSYIYRVEPTAVGNFAFNLTDDASGLALVDQPLSFDGLLARPFYTEKGSITLDMYSLAGFDQTARIVLYVIEPMGGRQ